MDIITKFEIKIWQILYRNKTLKNNKRKPHSIDFQGNLLNSSKLYNKEAK